MAVFRDRRLRTKTAIARWSAIKGLAIFGPTELPSPDTRVVESTGARRLRSSKRGCMNTSTALRVDAVQPGIELKPSQWPPRP